MVSILAVSETWLGPSIPDCMVTIPGFQPPLRRDRNENGGGVCFYIHNNLSYVRRDDLENCELELTLIEVSDGSATVLVGCCYRPPDSLKSFYEKMDMVLEHMGDTRLPVVLLGEINAKHSEWLVGDSTNYHGRILHDLMDRHDMQQLVSQPTHLNSEGKPSSLLDLIFTNTPHLFSSSAEVMAPLATSDHLPVVVECSIAKTSFILLWAVNTPNGTMRWRTLEKWRMLFSTTIGSTYFNHTMTSMKFGIAGNQRFLTILNHSSQNLHENPKKSLVITLVLEEASLPNPSKKSTIQKSASIWKPWPLEDLLLSKKHSDSSNKTSQTNSL